MKHAVHAVRRGLAVGGGFWVLVACSSGNGATDTMDGGRASDNGVKFLRSSLEREPGPALDAVDAIAPVVQGNTEFAFDLFHGLGSETTNSFVSPFSISTAMAMAWAGAVGKAEEEIRTVFHFGEPLATHAGLNALSRAVTVTGAELVSTLANALWVAPSITPLAPYLDTLAVNYGAGVGVVDFSRSAEAAAAIDGWVSDQTNGTIPTLLTAADLPVNTKAVLTNTLYLKAKWEKAFDASSTTDQPFYRADGTQPTVKMMQQVELFQYAEEASFQAAALPYIANQGHAFDMVVLLPTGDLPTFEASLDAAELARITASLKPQQVDVSMPRFELRSSFHLRTTLASLGMPTPFEDDLAFTKISDSPPPGHIADVVHQVFVSVNEVGTEASAATAIIFKDGGVAFNPTPPPVLRLDHPFLVVIRHPQTGTVLFLGRVADPTG
jgi:serpin B